MDASLRLRSVQHDRRCHSERSEESIAWMLRYAQHDRLGMANLILPVPLLRKERDVSASPKQGEVNPARECFTALMLAFSMTGWKWRTSPYYFQKEMDVSVKLKQGEVDASCA